MSTQKERSNPSTPKKRLSVWIKLTVFILGALAAQAIFFKRPQQLAPSANKSAQTFSVEDQAVTFAGYGGSASCKECHEEAYKAWATSHHGLAERLPSASLDEAAFSPARTIHHATQKTSFLKTNSEFEIITAGLSNAQQSFPVERVLGHEPLRQMLVPFPGGRWQVTEAAYDPRSNEWFNVYGDEDRRPGEWGHWTGRGMNWNTMCATCHNTRVRKNYDATNDVFHTAMAERSVSCESCHGPMKAHNDWQRANKGRSNDPTVRKLTRDQMLHTCAACHSRRAEITGDPKPGDNFFDHHLLSIVDESDLFFADGQVRDEDYEFTAFLGSRMFHKGVRCADCHEPHSAKVRLLGNMMCMSCHGSGATNAPIINPVTHSHHKVFGYDANGVMTNNDLANYKPDAIKETGGECVNCHMPQTTYMQRHSRHDHGFTIPDPLLTKQFNIPNACNRCHADKNADWSLAHVEKWYGDKMNRLTRTRAQTIARARLGDDSARVTLLKMLQTDEQDYWRAVAANLLEHWVSEPQIASALVIKLSDTNALVRQNIIQTLGLLGETATPDVREAINSRLKDPSRNVRIVAAQSLSSSLNTNSLPFFELQHMLNHNADQPTGQMQLGVHEFNQGNLTNALRHFQTAAKWDAFSPGIRHELAVLLSHMGRPREALLELQEAIRLAPRDAEFRFKLALAWNELGESAKALAELEQAVKLDPRHARAGYNLGLARNAAGNPTGAIEALLAAESSEPRDPAIPYARATIHARLGQMDDARRAARCALKLNPQFTEASSLLEQLQTR